MCCISLKIELVFPSKTWPIQLSEVGTVPTKPNPTEKTRLMASSLQLFSNNVKMTKISHCFTKAFLLPQKYQFSQSFSLFEKKVKSPKRRKKKKRHEKWTNIVYNNNKNHHNSHLIYFKLCCRLISWRQNELIKKYFMAYLYWIFNFLCKTLFFKLYLEEFFDSFCNVVFLINDFVCW